MRLQVQVGQMPERRLVAGNRRIEGSKACRQNLDAVEFGARVVEGAQQLLLNPIDCSVRFHALSNPRGKSDRPSDGSYFPTIDPISINKT